MKCPECQTAMPKKADFCPECGHHLTEEEKKAGKGKKKVLWFILVPVLALILVFAVFVFFATFVTSSVELVSLDVPAENIDYDDAIPVDISVECFGMAKKTFEVPVYIDGDLVHTFVIDYGGSKMGKIEIIDASYDVSDDVSTLAGEHTVAAGNLTDNFNVYTAACFNFSCDADVYYYLTDYTFSVDCVVENTGETAGECDCVSLFDDSSIDDRTLEIAGKSSETFAVDVFTTEEGIHIFEFGGETYEMPFYTAKRGTTGKLMEPTVNGSGYIDFDNVTANDMIVYFTSTEDNYTAVLACYIRAGESYRIDSLATSTYNVFVQIGEDFMPTLNRFYGNRQVYYVGGIEFNPKTSDKSLEMTQSLLDEYKTEIDFIPYIEDNMN